MPREVQSNLITVGMRIRKSMSDHAYKSAQAPTKEMALDFGKPVLTSNLSSSRMTPYADTIQRDPFAAFRAKGKADHEAIQARLASEAAAAKVMHETTGQSHLKRAREDDVATIADEDELTRETSFGSTGFGSTSFGSTGMQADPNWEFTAPVWLCSQESLMDDGEHRMRE